jgi:prepilin-type processing-associated H-X9-DG protein
MSTLSYEPVTANRRSHPLRRLVGWSVGIILLLLLLIGILAPSLCRSSETANRVKCASNQRQIGQAILLYANEHGGKYPDRLEDLFLAGADVVSELFCCPSSNDEKALGQTMAEIAANLSQPGRLSYVYLGKGLTTSSPPETPVLYEPIANHDNDGGNVLFADGHVEWYSRKELAQLPGVQITSPSSSAAR